MNLLNKLITFRGISDHIVILNFLRAHNHPSNLILIINSEDHEQKFFTEKLKLEQLPLLSNER